MKSIALIGANGHHDAVLDELLEDGGFSFVGLAPATPEDNLDAVLRRQRVLCPESKSTDRQTDRLTDRLTDRPTWAPAPRVFATPEELLDATHPDIAIVSARFDRLPYLSALAARHGCHVISEKPLALDLPALDMLWKAVSDAGVQCATMLSNREQPVLAAALASIRRGDIGRVVLLNARKSYRWGTRPEWYGDRSLYGGTIPWIGIHALDFIQAAAEASPEQETANYKPRTAKPRFASVSARHVNLGHPDRPGCEDVCLLDATLEGGVLASATLDYFRPACAPTHGDDWIRIVGTEGILEAAMERGTCTLLAPGSDSAPLPLAPRAPTHAAWLRSLPPRGTRSAPDAVTRRGFLLTQAALVAREAADTNRVLDIPDAPWLCKSYQTP